MKVRNYIHGTCRPTLFLPIWHRAPMKLAVHAHLLTSKQVPPFSHSGVQSAEEKKHEMGNKLKYDSNIHQCMVLIKSQCIHEISKPVEISFAYRVAFHAHCMNSTRFVFHLVGLL